MQKFMYCVRASLLNLNASHMAIHGVVQKMKHSKAKNAYFQTNIKHIFESLEEAASACTDDIRYLIDMQKIIDLN